MDLNTSFDWTNQLLAALEPLDDVFLDRPSSVLGGGSKEDLSSTDLSLLRDRYFESAYFSFPFLNRDRFLADSTGGCSPAMSALVYAVALAGCAHSHENPERQVTCYNLACEHA
ncbi:hypothetical protein G6011_03718 [Alternaria panax]|uniref:Uncharacterized protein n=1 Tax=Alternaria panax TaxID=48097 RepID=A0AAD4IF84_9PLEO|nr:hypothetical protein G6011_03718 [Alternaria panax]